MHATTPSKIIGLFLIRRAAFFSLAVAVFTLGLTNHICYGSDQTEDTDKLQALISKHLSPKNLEEIESLVSRGADIEVRDSDDATLLFQASENGCVDIVDLLLQKGAKVDTTSKGYSPLSVASERGHFEAVKLLLAQGAEVDQSAVSDNPASKGVTPLYLACQGGHTKVAKLLIEHGAKVNKEKADGATPLHCSAFGCHLDIVKLLLANKANVNAVESTHGETALTLATQANDTRIVRVLLAGSAQPDTLRKDEFMPLHIACFKGNIEIVSALIENKAKIDSAAKDGSTPLLIASGNGHLEIVKLLLSKGADLEKANTDGLTPLISASAENHIAIVKLLLGKGAKANRDSKGWTALRFAKQRGNREVAQLLEEHAGKADGLPVAPSASEPVVRQEQAAKSPVPMAVKKMEYSDSAKIPCRLQMFPNGIFGANDAGYWHVQGMNGRGQLAPGSEIVIVGGPCDFGDDFGTVNSEENFPILVVNKAGVGALFIAGRGKVTARDGTVKELGSEFTFEKAVSLIGSTEDLERKAGIWTLMWRAQTPEQKSSAEQIFLKLLQSKNESQFNQIILIQGLGKIGSKSSLKALKEIKARSSQMERSMERVVEDSIKLLSPPSR